MGKSLIVKLGGIGVAIVIAVVASFVFSKGSEKVAEAKAPKVGECITVTGTVNAQTDDKDCGDADATFKVTGNKGDCDPSEDTLSISVGKADSGNVAELCLGLNAAKGDCFRLTATESTKVECAANKGDAEVALITSVGKSGTACANGAQPLDYKKRNTLLCLAPNA